MTPGKIQGLFFKNNHFNHDKYLSNKLFFSSEILPMCHLETCLKGSIRKTSKKPPNIHKYTCTSICQKTLKALNYGWYMYKGFCQITMAYNQLY